MNIAHLIDRIICLIPAIPEMHESRIDFYSGDHPDDSAQRMAKP
jgi:hypothetical protein